MRHLNSGYHYTCATCATEIDGMAVFHVGLPFCCSVCATGRPCNRSDQAVLGRRVTVVEQEEDSVNYALAFPGDGAPAQGWISTDSPLGTAVPGERVDVIAPAGRRVVSLLAVE